MSATITNLARSIDTIARRCPRGLSALAGDAPQLSHDELARAIKEAQGKGVRRSHWISCW